MSEPRRARFDVGEVVTITGGSQGETFGLVGTRAVVRDFREGPPWAWSHRVSPIEGPFKGAWMIDLPGVLTLGPAS